MRAVMYEEFGGVPRVAGLPDPVPPPHGVVIRVEATGLCRSDWHGWMGHEPGIALPHVPGHELAGVVEAAGPEVTGHRAGERVTVPFVCACGRCAACSAGEQQVCEHQTQPGFTHWGSFAEYVAIDHADVNLVPLPGSMDVRAAAALGCRFATAFRALTVHGRVAPGAWVAVHGCGGVGLSAVMIAAAAGARVVAVDVSPAALDLATTFGAAACVQGPGGVPEAIRELTSGGAHVSLDALGNAATCADSIACLRRRGRHIQVGLLPEAPEVAMDRVIAYELAVLGSHGMPARAYGPMLDLVAAGTLRPDRLVTATIGLAETPAALTAMGTAPPAGVTIIEP
ncbi:zinc-dependent alcohol dehydrogenase family protein [Actinomadura sp. DC4]|uniref:zinc-dependent alcohol dehydrogenase family protein n=1 Tax=Actinomadura sp. DC4 TaxID=3055069 RepID=UPI0025B01A54|nr:zinc-dependent alcohol dehydrogenase family protein [Actinomadura sp. DC4]MDN3356149.1 zinc-dependent alcohol dehydrogenase family protein [Actinomadura sp. DC4]